MKPFRFISLQALIEIANSQRSILLHGVNFGEVKTSLLLSQKRLKKIPWKKLLV